MRFTLLTPLVAFASLAVSSAYAAPAPAERASNAVTPIYQFPPGTWAENLAVRSSGPILTTLLFKPEVWQVNPDTKQATLVASLPDKLVATGIVETTKDVFAVAAGNVTLPLAFGNSPLGFSVFTVDVSKYEPATGKGAVVKRVADLPQAIFLNGAAALNAANGVVLFSDSLLGAVWRVNVKTGEVKKVIASAALKAPLFATPLGVNGIRTVGHALYFQNTGAKTFNKVTLNADGTPAGPITTLLSNQNGDDFDIQSGTQTAYLATNLVGNSVVKVNFAARTSADAVTAQQAPQVAGATSIRFGRRQSDSKTFYGSTALGAIYAVDTTLL